MKKINLFTMIMALMVMSMGFGSSSFAQLYGPNLVDNGDFTDNSEGTFATDYLYVNPNQATPNTTLQPEGVYTIGADAGDYHNSFTGTAFSAPYFLIVNGHTQQTMNQQGIQGTRAIVWQQTVDIEEGVDYEFSFMLSSLVTSSPAELRIVIDINGEEMVEVVAPGTTNNWVQHVWSSMDKSETATITIYDDNIVAGGNDFGIDNIVFRSVGPEPAPMLKISPVLECVKNNGDGTYTALFGYLNRNEFAVNIPVGVDNKLTGNAIAGSLIEDFEAGRVIGAFEIIFDGNDLVWTLKTPDNGASTSTANAGSDRCPCEEELELTAQGVMEVCAGEATGSLYASVTNGVAPFSFVWNDEFVGAERTDLAAGEYTLTVTDDNGCEVTETFVIAEFPAMDVEIAVTDVTCNGAEDGIIDVVMNGAKPFNICISYGCEPANDEDFTPVKSQTATYTGLVPGNWKVTVVDANGCMYTECVTVGEPEIISFELSYDEILCNGETTEVTVTGFGGNPPYTLFDGEVAVETFDSEYTLAIGAGEYNWTLGDSNGCEPAVISFELTEPTLLTADYSATEILCNGELSTVTVTADGGTTDYQLFDGDVFAADLTDGEVSLDVPAGTYNWTVVDANGCEAMVEFTVTEPTLLTADYTATEILCNGELSTVTVTADGGTAAYQLFNGDDFVADLTDGEVSRDVPAGTYNWTVIDANGCEAMVEFTVTEPTLLTADYTATPILCNGDLSTVTITVDGGIAPYELHDGEDKAGHIVENVFEINVLAGTYNWTISDANGCEVDVNITINEPALLEVSLVEPQDASCFGAEDGMAWITVTGGTAPYSADMGSFDGDMLVIENLAAGSYDVKIYDANQCYVETSFMIGQPEELIVNVDDIEVPLCAPENAPGCEEPFIVNVIEYAVGTAQYGDGTVSENRQVVENVLGAPDYSNSGNNGITFTTLGFTGHMIVELGCDVIDGEGDDLMIVETSYGISDCDNYPEKAQIAVSMSAGGPWTVLGVNCLTGGADLANGGVESARFVKITDASSEADFNNGDGFDLNGIEILNAAGGAALSASATLSFSGVEDGMTPVFSVMEGDAVISVSNSADLSGLMPGTYSVVLTVDGCSSAPVEFTVPTFPEPIVASAVVNDVSCNGGSDGSAEITITGGTGPYTVVDAMLPPQKETPTQNISNLSAGTYTYTIIDANLCMGEVTFTVGEPELLEASVETGMILCNGGSTNLDLTITGGTEPYVLSDNNGDFTLDIAAAGVTPFGIIFAGDYSWTVTDANDCSVLVEFAISQPEPIVADKAYDAITCFGGTTDITVTADGGTGEFSLYNGSVAVENLVATFVESTLVQEIPTGSYSWIVVDENGCEFALDFNIDQPTELTAEVEPGTILCFDGETSALVSAAGGTMPYSLYNGESLVAEFNEEGFVVENLSAGTYSWTVVDANGCGPVELSFTLVNPDPIVIEVVSTTDILCFGNNSGIIEVSATGGTGDLTYSLNGGEAQNNGLFTELFAGDYVITVTDANGCTADSDVIKITEPEELTVDLTVTNASCEGEWDGQISGMISGGVGPYNVCLFTECTIDDTQEGENMDKSQGIMYWGLPAGNYMIRVMDQNGCVWMECVEVGTNEVTVANEVVDACEAEAVNVSFVQPLENVDGDTSGWSTNSSEVYIGTNTITILDGAATITAYENYSTLQLASTIAHRANRGIGVRGQGTNDEIARIQGMIVDFEAPVYLMGFEVRSLFVEGTPAVAEQGKAALYSDGNLIEVINLVAVETPGSNGQLVVNLSEPAMIDRIDLYIEEDFKAFSEFALAKLTIAEVTPLVNINVTPEYPGAAGFNYVWGNGSTDQNLMGVEPGSYTVIVTALDNEGEALCSTMMDINAETNCDVINFPMPADDDQIADDDYKNETPLSDNLMSLEDSKVKVYPNPFKTQATFEFNLTQNADVTLEVYNLIGERVAVVFQGTVNAFENHKAVFNAESLPNGIYIYKLTAGDYIFNDRVVLTR